LALIIGGCFRLGRLDGWGDVKELAEAGDVGGAVAVGKQPIVADAVEALGEDVHEEAADEQSRLMDRIYKDRP
jgi:hypothetical protein